MRETISSVPKYAPRRTRIAITNPRHISRRVSIEAVAVGLRSEKDVVVGCGVNSLEKSWLKQNFRRALSQLRRAKIFKPVLRTFDSVSATSCPSCNFTLADLLPATVRLP